MSFFCVYFTYMCGMRLGNILVNDLSSTVWWVGTLVGVLVATTQDKESVLRSLYAGNSIM